MREELLNRVQTIRSPIKDNINAGTQAKIVVTGCGDYGGEIQKEFTIKPANVQSHR